ncbi:MAG: carbonic anhydrase, partial [Planctomycetes bacterium]|nr:carbonic anhydrase [Planctomycetota bacterium]
DLMKGYRRFRNGRYGEQARHYEEIAAAQRTNVMLIGCADSRVDPSDIFDTAPGELFTVRNVANLVAPCPGENAVLSVGAALEFAVCSLKVRHIVVMGHAGCGGVKACLDAGNGVKPSPRVGAWVEHLEPARKKALAENPADPQLALEWAGVRQSLTNLETYPFVKEAIDAGELFLHGAWFGIVRGELSWLEPEEDTFHVVPY